jgi:predicted MPP superfamily phosphohydrolase
VHEPNNVEVVRRTLTVRDLPIRLDGMTAVQISDLHLQGIAPVYLHMIDLVRDLKPDLLLLTGDLVDKNEAIRDLLDLLDHLQPPLGTWAVPGNWDHTSRSVEDLIDELPSVHVRFLLNESAQLEEGFWVVGVDDPATRHDDLPSAMHDAPMDARTLLLAHSPDIVRNLGARRFDVVLAGHTHGGQINLPIFNGAWLKAGFSSRYVHGLYRVNGSTLYVNRGIGMTTFPVRVACRPEVTYFTFRGE